MPKKIVPRHVTITIDGQERVITEAELLTLSTPLIILGDPGMGKTNLTETLATKLGTNRISAGLFARTAHPERLLPPKGQPLVIDGLDELATSTGSSAGDEVLKKLSALNLPPFILSCRAADWQGSADRQKITEDYGVVPTTARLEPLSRQDAKDILSDWQGIDAESVLDQMDARGLGEFYRNPLTLNLLAVIASGGKGLPQGRADLLAQASAMLCQEENAIHARTTVGMADVSALQDSAGAIFAHLLLAGIQGIADLPQQQIPEGYIAVGELADLPESSLTREALKTRLFQVSGENLLFPYHRVIAEFLAARWLAKRLNVGLSPRRIEQALTFSGGVPTALRGLYAWNGHFAPSMTRRCIEIDPYGALRYGDPDQLSLPDARALLDALIALANEDPYFRSEDWGKHSVAAIARPELKAEILALLKTPGRHLHLTTLILESLPQTALVGEIAPDLEALVTDETAPFAERDNAAEALITAKLPVDWPAIVKRLNSSTRTDSQRLALETMGNADPDAFDPDDIVQAIITNHNLFSGNEDHHVSTSDYRLTQRISATAAGLVLNSLAKQVAIHRPNYYWRMGHSAAGTILRLIIKALEGPVPDLAKFWTWLLLVQGDRLHDNERQKVADFIKQDLLRKRALQAIAFADSTIDGGPFMSVASALPQASPALYVSADDVVHFMDEIAVKPNLSNFDVELWTALIRSHRGEKGIEGVVRDAGMRSVSKHALLRSIWDQFEGPMPDDWRRQEEVRSAKAARAKARNHQKHRQQFAPLKSKIQAGQHLGALNDFAKAYLDHYLDLDHDGHGIHRLKEWLGDELAVAALEGFVKALDRTDLPTAKQIADTHAEGKTWNSEAVMICGVSELVRTGKGLAGVRPEMLQSALAAWWEFPDSFNEKVGADVQPQLEQAVFGPPGGIEAFLRVSMEPAIAAGHDRIPGLYQLPRDDRYHGIAGSLAVDWLKRFPDAKASVQHDLIQIADRFGQRSEIRDLAIQRVAVPIVDPELRAIWMGALFVSAFDDHVAVLSAYAHEDADRLWAFAGASHVERGERWQPLSVAQLEFAFTAFAPRWPAAFHPQGGWGGSRNPWDASEYLRALINILGADSSKGASEALDRLAVDDTVANYRDHIKHVRAQQMKLRRDTIYQVPTFQQIKATLKGAVPDRIDDLKAVTLDALERVQKYVRDGDTRAWLAYWSGGKPLVENDCRDRLLDDLRPYLPSPVQALPEVTMPDVKRSDIAVINGPLGLPIEIKGQWHPEVWTAPSSQLIEKYTRDFRANGRGLYLVLWFGNDKGKPLTKDPNNSAPPADPSEMRDRLLATLTKDERTRVDIIVLDVSKTA